MKYITIFILFISNNLFSQTEIGNPDSSYLRIIYNEIPDSLLVNNEIKFINKGGLLNLNPGIYEIYASKECYTPVKKTVTVVPKTTRNVLVTLKPINSKLRDRYNYNLYSNSVLMPIIGTLSLIYKNYNVLLPTTIHSVAEIYWHQGKEKFIKPCAVDYPQQIENKSSWKFYLDFFSLSHHVLGSKQNKATYTRSGEGYHIVTSFSQKITFKEQENLTFNPVLGFRAKKYFTETSYFDLSILMAYRSSLKISIKEKTQLDIIFRDYVHDLNINFPILFESSLNMLNTSILDQNIGITIGAFLGNPAIPKYAKVPIQYPYYPREVYNKKDKIKLRESFAGLFTGVFFKLPISEDLSYSTQIRIYSEGTWALLQTSVGLSYNLFSI